MKSVCSLLPALALCVALPAWAQQGPIPLLPAPAAVPSPTIAGYLHTTTDSSEYCKHLHGRVDDLMRGTKASAADQVRSLSEEGERLCRHGQTRSGIQHLRRAYVLLRPPETGR